MPGASRSLPDRPSLRYLKLEAKRRLAAGEFGTLHEAQAAIAREHGLPGWAALKHLICGPVPESAALARLEAVFARFRGADGPSWTPPGEDEMRRHFDDRVLAETPPGELVASIARLAEEAFTELGVAGLLIAGGGPGAPMWAVARGWADLNRGEGLDSTHRFPASGVAALVTTTAVLRLVADGRFGLDDGANDHLSTVRLPDDTITVRELLSHTAGVTTLAGSLLFADRVPDLVTLTGPVVAYPGPRGTVRTAQQRRLRGAGAAGRRHHRIAVRRGRHPPGAGAAGNDSRAAGDGRHAPRHAAALSAPLRARLTCAGAQRTIAAPKTATRTTRRHPSVPPLRADRPGRSPGPRRCGHRRGSGRRGWGLLEPTEPTEMAVVAAFGHTAVLAGVPGNAETLAARQRQDH